MHKTDKERVAAKKKKNLKNSNLTTPRFGHWLRNIETTAKIPLNKSRWTSVYLNLHPSLSHPRKAVTSTGIANSNNLSPGIVTMRWDLVHCGSNVGTATPSPSSPMPQQTTQHPSSLSREIPGFSLTKREGEVFQNANCYPSKTNAAAACSSPSSSALFLRYGFRRKSICLYLQSAELKRASISRAKWCWDPRIHPHTLLRLCFSSRQEATNEKPISSWSAQTKLPKQILQLRFTWNHPGLRSVPITQTEAQ